ncbi:MAG: putative cytokinetic ring protein SteA, partial [Arcanobacterium sp.]|nr:putative cytokinetic ring protein SteA [Arcanobacterium sp.]
LLIDDLGSSVMDIAEGASVVISPAGEVRVGEQLIAQGTVLSSETNTENLARARSGLPLQLKAFASNTMAYVEAQQALILDGVGIPEVRTQIAGKHVMVVARGHRYREELKELRHYIREYQPVIIGVDAGADAVLEAGYHLSMIVGDMDSVSEKALRSGAEIVVHGSPEGHNPGERRVQDLGLPHIVFAAVGMSDDVAILLAAAHDADLIVAVGSYSTLAEAFDRGRRGMASALITRLQVGAKLVDANAVLHLYRSRISNWQLALFIVAGAAAIGTAMIATAAGQVSVGIAGSWFAAVGAWLGGIF